MKADPNSLTIVKTLLLQIQDQQVDYNQAKSLFEKEFGPKSFYVDNLFNSLPLMSSEATRYQVVLLQCPYLNQYGLGCDAPSMGFLNEIFKTIEKAAADLGHSFNLLSLERHPWCPKLVKTVVTEKDKLPISNESLECNNHPQHSSFRKERIQQRDILKKQLDTLVKALEVKKPKTMQIYNLEDDLRKLELKISEKDNTKASTSAYEESLLAKILECKLAIIEKKGIIVDSIIAVGSLAKKTAEILKSQEIPFKTSSIPVHPAFIIRKFSHLFKASKDGLSMTRATLPNGYGDLSHSVSEKTYHYALGEFFLTTFQALIKNRQDIHTDHHQLILNAAYSMFLETKYGFLYPKELVITTSGPELLSMVANQGVKKNLKATLTGNFFNEVSTLRSLRTSFATILNTRTLPSNLSKSYYEFSTATADFISSEASQSDGDAMDIDVQSPDPGHDHPSKGITSDY